MATNFQEFTTKINLNAEEAKKQLDILSNRAKEYRKLRDEAAKAGDKKAMEKYAKEINELDKAMKRYRTQSQNVAHTLKNLSDATLSDLKKAQKALNKEMQEVPRNSEYYQQLKLALQQVKDEMRGIKNEAKEAGRSPGRHGEFLQKTFSNYMAYIMHDIQSLAVNFIGKVKDMVVESTELAKSAEGIEMAFDRINQPGLLDNLRQATHGTVTDIELMKQAVKFKDFNLPVEQLGTYLAFAQQKAKDTGESIDYLVNSIVTGLGRQSPQILDNLGLSAKQISEEAKKSGDFFGAVAKIVEQNMRQTGEYVETAAERSTKANVRLQNEQAELGKALLPLREKIDETYGTLQMKAIQAVKWLYDNRKEVSEMVKVFTRFAVEGAIITGVWNAMTIATKAHSAAIYINQALHRGWTVVAGTARAAGMAISMSWTLLTKGVQAYTVQLRAARIASITNPWTALATVLLTVGVAVYELVTAFSKEEDAAKKAKAATDEFNATQKLLKSVSEEANSSISEEMTRFNQLRKTLEDNKAKLDDRKKALVEIKKLCPEYHGQLTTENRLINSNTTALDGYITNLKRAALARAAFNKMVALQENALNHEQALRERQANQQWAQNQLRRSGVADDETINYNGYGGTYSVTDAMGNSRSISREEGRRLLGLQKVVRYNDERIKQENTILETNKKQSDILENIVKKNGGVSETSGTSSGGSVTGGASGSGGSGKKTKKTGSTTNKEETERKKKMRKEIEDQKALNDQLQAQNMSQYYQGEKTYREYITKQHELTIEGYDALMDIYKKYGENYLQLSDERAKAEMAKESEVGRFRLKDLERCYQLQKVMIQQQYNDQSSDLYRNEEALNETLFMQEITYLEDKKALYREGTEEYAEIEAEITIREQEHKLDLEQQYQERLEQYREEWLNLGNEKQMAIAMHGLETLHKNGLIKEEEYQKMRLAIQAQYAKNPTQQKNAQFDKNVGDAISVAQSQAEGGYDKSQGISMTNNPIMGEITQYKSVMEQLKILREQDKISHQEYQQAKADVTAEFLTNMVSQVQAAYDSINNVMSAASSFYAAQSQYEQNVTTKKYDKEIEAAGNNEKKRKRLEQQKQKELAAIKTKYNKKAMKIELAQAVASTALAAINSYASASKVSWVLGPIAAALATAAGMIQIAAIKKQHQAEEAGFYEGGFTGGSNYKKKAGIVHEGEFVVNHDGVNNPNLMPLLSLFDLAQRNNRIGSLTARDVSGALGNGSAAIITPIVNVETDNSELKTRLYELSETITKLNRRLDNGIHAISVISGPDGTAHQLELFEKMKSNV